MQYFGTDGIRGIAGKELTCELVLKASRALAHICKELGQSKILLAKDTRLSGDMLEAAACAGILSEGLDVHKLSTVSTPAAAYLTRFLNADACIMLTASHNQSLYNGIKMFDSSGKKFSEEIEKRIEKIMDASISYGTDVGKIVCLYDAHSDYENFIISLCNSKLKNKKIVVDCANGALYKIAPSIFKKLGANIIAINAKNDGALINHECGSTYPGTVRKAVLKHKADIGFAFDGDGDRILVCDSSGKLYGGDSLLYIFAKHLKTAGRLFDNTVVGTVMTNLGMELSLKELDINLVRVDVGDKFILEKMLLNNYSLGGEESGHIVIREKLITGDGLISAITLLNIMAEYNSDLEKLTKDLIVFPQVLINVIVPENYKKKILTHNDVVKTVTSCEKQLEKKGRIVFRASGTEPKLRIMAEGENLQLVESLAKDIEYCIVDTLQKLKAQDKNAGKV
ncbi:MAG: phosphoglucosamine mutase [Firmicutes bacterium]|nr:phosphoglucosamine mutase [Bacillota bacterium]